MNTMNLAHFQDFYYLEALRAGITMANSANPDNLFRRSVEKLTEDVERAFAELCDTMSLHILVYMWAAALGEARYSGGECGLALTGIDGRNRSAVYNDAKNYCPTPENIDALRQVFSAEWSGGFGGEAWLTIVEGIAMYGKVSNATFIDHAVDLEHNGGSVFTKCTPRHIGLDTYQMSEYTYYSPDSLRLFCNRKFSHDILNMDELVFVSRKVYNLITRYSNIIAKCDVLDYAEVRLEWLQPFSVEWGTDDLEVTEACRQDIQTCERCGYEYDEDEMIFHDDEWYCESCFEDTFKQCSKCQDYFDTDDVHETPSHPTFYQLCDDCANKLGFVACYDCGEYIDNGITPEDDDDVYCKDCAEKYHCEECDKYFYHLDEHEQENHTEEESEEVEEHEEETGYIFKENKPVTFHNSQDKITVKGNYYQWGIYTDLVILDIESFNTKTGKHRSNPKSHLWTVTSMLAGKSVFASKTKLGLQQAKEILRIAIQSGIDWGKVENQIDFDNLPKYQTDYIYDHMKEVK